MNNRKKAFITISLALATVLASGQASPISINIRSVPGVGAVKVVEITLTNRSGKDVFFPCSDVSIIRMYVYAPDGSSALDTEKGAQLKRDQHKTIVNKTVCVSDALKSGQSVKQDIDIAGLYEMKTSGIYHVKAELDISDGSTAKSNQIAVEVRQRQIFG